jgi:hypothetical protein
MRIHKNLTTADHRSNHGGTLNLVTVDLAARPQPASPKSLVEERRGRPAARLHHVETVLTRDRPPGVLRAPERVFGCSKAGGHLVIRGCMTSPDARVQSFPVRA